MRLSELLRRAGVRPHGELGADPTVVRAVLDSRRVARGDLFFALRGLELDGEAFAADAAARGAVAVVAGSARPDWAGPELGWATVDDPRRALGRVAREVHGRPDESLTLIGVTGTNGKTTVTYLVESIARAAGRRVGRIGTVSYAFDGRETPAPRTTPEAPELYGLLAEMRDHDVQMVAIEVSSHALALARVEGARFGVAAFLNLGRDHLDFHADEREYFEAKARLFDTLPSDSHAVLPADDARGDELARRTAGKIWTFGRGARSTVRIGEERGDILGSRAVLSTPAGELPLAVRLPGRFNLDNAAAAATCALALGLPLEAIAAGIAALDRVPGRAERVERGQPFAVLVDYAHTADALGELLTWLAKLTSRRLRVVFGCGGERDRGKRFEMGAVAARLAQRVYVTSDNPRREDPVRIVAEVEAGASSVSGAAERVTVEPDRAAAIELAIGEAEDGDVVVIAGKGHETTQTVGDRVLPFDDRVVAAAALERRGWRGA
jgi:UDP-N-acetylmuramoyl-L-alanyl-D-glutamate--2,6-diaminopimelate ligase